MPQPFNYALNIPDPMQQLGQTMNIGFGIRKARLQEQQAQQQMQQQQQMQADLAALSENPTPANTARMMARYPQLSEQFKRTYDVLDHEQQKAKVGQASEVYAALEAGQNDIAQERLLTQATAHRNSGQEREAKTLDDLARLIELNPGTAKTTTGLFLANAMGPDKFAETFTKLQSDRRLAAREGADLTKAQAEAQKAATAADFAKSNAVIDLEKKGWDIFKLQEDVRVKRENSRIAAIKAQQNKTVDSLKREELQLKIDEAERKRDAEIRENVAEVTAAVTTTDNMITTIDRILKMPMDTIEDATGPLDASAVGRAADYFDDDVQDLNRLVETLGSQAFLTQLPHLRGFGNLSQTEGDKLQISMQSFDRRQSTPQFIKNLNEARRLLLKMRTNIAKKHGVPEPSADLPEAEFESEKELTEALSQYK